MGGAVILYDDPHYILCLYRISVFPHNNHNERRLNGSTAQQRAHVATW
jgi:hypothetical protein